MVVVDVVVGGSVVVVGGTVVVVVVVGAIVVVVVVVVGAVVVVVVVAEVNVEEGPVGLLNDPISARRVASSSARWSSRSRRMFATGSPAATSSSKNCCADRTPHLPA